MKMKAVRINGIIAVDKAYHATALEKLLDILKLNDDAETFDKAEFGYVYSDQHKFEFVEQFGY